MKVDFFIVGAQKSGTTALYSKLSRMGGVQIPLSKEIHFFDNEELNWNQAGYEKLNAWFDWSIEKTIRGEATPIYCYWPESLQRIHDYNPAAKIIMLLRHPAHRAHSQWRMEFQRGAETLEFAEAIAEQGRQRVEQAPRGVHRIYSYVERGFYSKQIKRLKEVYPEDQCLFLKTDELWLAPHEVLKKITSFLGLGFSAAACSNEYVAPMVDAKFPVPQQENLCVLLHQLTSLYEDDIQETERLTGLFLADWLAPDYVEPMVRP